MVWNACVNIDACDKVLWGLDLCTDRWHTPRVVPSSRLGSGSEGEGPQVDDRDCDSGLMWSVPLPAVSVPE